MSTANPKQNKGQHNIRIKLKDFLHQWDLSSKKQRTTILERFCSHFKTKINDNNIHQVDKELGEVAPLFFSRILSSFQMNHENPNLVPGHIGTILIYLQSSNSKEYGERFVNAGGIQLTLYVLQHRCIYAADIQCQSLFIIKIIIKLNMKFKEIICDNGGIELLLNILVDRIGPVHQNLLYSIYDILKQLCIRNETYKLTIHQLIIKYMNNNSENEEAIKTMLKILQATLTFIDDIRMKDGNKQHAKSSELDGHIVSNQNMDHILKLLQLGNHQVIYELRSLCSVVLKSRGGQIILLQSLIKLLNTSEDKNRKEYLQFAQKVVQKNIGILTSDAKTVLNQSGVDLL